MEADLEAIGTHLLETRAPVDQLRAPHAHGVYAVFAGSENALTPIRTGRHGLLYIGASKDLAGREFEQHFNSASTGFSTLRRTLGAILKDRLQLRAIPRSPGSKPSSYRLHAEDEGRLTDWMRSNLLVGVCGIGTAWELERQLIRQLEPPLNLMHWPNPQRGDLKRLRKACTDEAQGR